MWPQNIRWSVIGIEARKDPSPKREELGFVPPPEATREHMWSSAFQMALNTSYLALCFQRTTLTSSLPGGGQAAKGGLGSEKTE